MDYFEKYFAEALRFLSARPRSEKEVRDNLGKKLQKDAQSTVLVEKVIKTLKEQKFLDDEAFALWWIEQRMLYRQKGNLVIKQELHQKGISNELIAKVLQENPVDQVAIAKKLLRKKIERYKNFSVQEQRIKLQRLLRARGFDYDTIRTSIDEILTKDV